MTRLASSLSIHSPKKLIPHSPPSFASKLNVPKHRLRIANLPTPIQEIDVDSSNSNVFEIFKDLNVQFLMKRDDMSGGVELGGNKIRKLEFLLADALEKGCDSVVTIGGEQSNHCRATAAACRMVNIEPHLILRTRRANQVEKDKCEKNEDSFGYVGNILFDRIVGANIHTCTPGEYGRFGSNELVDRVCKELSAEDKKVYPIPVGGSNALGTWGYIEAVGELKSQLNGEKVDHVVFACGSGGTATGIAIGLALAFANDKENLPQIHAIGVCDDPDYFYNEISLIAKDMGFSVGDGSINDIKDFVENIVVVHQGKGKGYAASTQEELDFILQFSIQTGIVLDPVYSGKALFRFMQEVKNNPNDYRDSRIMFWHTGGSLGAYEKIESMKQNMNISSPIKRMDVYGKGLE
ncbi:tryptophan synthase beta subunit-like PLP-dependent enzyme [Chaetoceros tenuissimus]|uniref:Tryptophan synthase beta subunit-like PLP-dependent enzyme n=1 Tax=Chaetoceros tenuissimus TaxID=426638 RepID=A0AAD3CXK8_9STRA|nr:tryptophan synthase beta subunit-like PLP-dependent enzyme [Chaetoceros tenuissimus]